jgi:hypothetical protein
VTLLGTNGKRLSHVLGSQPVVALYALQDRAFAWLVRDAGAYSIIDLNSGRVVGVEHRPLPTPLVGSSQSFAS